MQIPAETLSQSHRLCFIGKERDSETGFSYFGARCYDSDLMTSWLSVDPMADKYPSLSPYAYCAWTRPTGADEHRLIEFNIANNPIRLVDPDGKMIVPNDDGWNVNHREKTITKVSDNGGNYTQIEYNNSGEIINTSFSSIDNFIQQYESLGYAVNRIENKHKNIGVNIGEETSLNGTIPIGMGIAAELIDKLGNTIYNKKNGTWIGKDGKFAGKLFGFSSQIITAANIEMDYRSGNLTQFGRILEHGINIGSSIPLYGTVFSVFYELGKEHGPSTWF